MNDMSNTPVMPAGPKPFFQVWMDALTKPNESTFAQMANSPSAKATTAYLWIFIGYVINFFLSSIVQNQSVRTLLEKYGGSGVGAGVGSGIAGRLVVAVCGAPIAALIATLFFAIGVAIIQWVAKMFGGRGNFGQMSYALAAILAPFSIVSGLLSLLSAIPFVGFCFSLLILIAALYIIVLEVMAVKGVNQFGWGAAIGSLFIPGLVIGFICACLAGISFVLLGTALQSVIQQIQQGMGTTPGY